MARFAAPARTITTEILVWKGISVLVSYEADWQGLARAGFVEGWAHLELQAFAPVDAPLPQTDDGYHSTFLARGCVEAAGGPSACAREWLDEMAQTLSWRVTLARWERVSDQT